MTKARTPAYFAVARGTHDHQIFMRGRRPMSRYEAWLWLIEKAAWKDTGHRHVLGVVGLERSQLSFTQMELAKAWRWPKTNVHRFLHYLAGREMVNLEAAMPSGLKTGLKRGPYRTVITICNYDKFQPVKRRADSQADSNRERHAPQLPGFIPEIPTKHQQTTESVESSSNYEGRLKSGSYGDNSSRLGKGRLAGESKPPHGARNRKAQVRWFDYGTEEWKEAAEFDRTYRGLETFPRRYADGGRGNWFKERSREEWQDWARIASR